MINLNSNQQSYFDSAYSIAIQQGATHSIATAIASEALLGASAFQPLPPRTDLETVCFDLQRSGEEIIVQTDGDEEFITAVLASDEHLWTPEETQRFVEAINTQTPVGDVDHATLKDMIKRGYTNAQIQQEIKGKKGIVKAVKALIEEGKVFVRLLIDKRYREVVKRAKGLSVEAIRPKQVVGSGQWLGFTVAVNEDPAYSGATFINA